MSSKGLKRPLELDSVPDVQPVSDSDDDLSSPECLLSLQPVEDDYSSDDEAKKKLRDMQRVNNKDGMSLKEISSREFMLRKYQNSSQTRCEVVKYLYYINFIKRKDEVCLKSATVEQCLYHSLQFMSHAETEALEIEEFKIDGKSIKEVCEYYTQNPRFPWQWIMENDDKNLHDLTTDEYQKVKKNFSQNGNFKKVNDEDCSKMYEKSMKKIAYASFVKAICKLFETIYNNRNEDELETADEEMKQLVEGTESGDLIEKLSEGSSITEATSWMNSDVLSTKQWTDLSERSDMVKKYLRELLFLLPYMNFRKNGECKSKLHLVVENPDLTADNNLIEDKRTIFIVKPDGVVIRTRYDNQIQDYKDSWALPIEVYGPYEEDVVSEMNKAETEPQEIGPPPTPRKYLGETRQMRSCNLMLNPEYRAELRKSIKESIPIQCDTPHCMDKIAGQHVLQLLAMTQQALSKGEIQPYNYVMVNKTGFFKGIGLFIVNEFVYFSKLLIEPQTMTYFTVGTCPAFSNAEIPNLLKEGNMRPKMSYANFRFDLTIANHRKAFILFLNQFVDHE